MPIVNIICSICTEVFKSSGEAVSTSCGHLFHHGCLNEWLIRERTCPQCRAVNQNSHPVHLSFIVSEQPAENQEYIELQIKTSEEKVAELLIQNEQLENNLREIQEQYSLAESSKTELELKLSEMNNTEEDFLRLQEQYTDISEMRKHLEDHINQLCVENECKIKELELRTNENEQLKSSLNADYFVLPNNALGEKIKDIERRLQIVTEDLEKEVKISAKLSVEKIKLQSRIDSFYSSQNEKDNTPKEKARNPRANNVVRKQLRHATSPQRFNIYVNSLIIKGLPLSELMVPLKNVVMNLALKMHVVLSSDDLVKIDIINADLQNSNNATISVQFKNITTKEAFLSNSKTLQADTNTNPVFVEEFMNDEIRDLYIYAKKRLHNRGLIYFYIENNQVFAKKNRMHSDIVHITSKSCVDRTARVYDLKKLQNSN